MAGSEPGNAAATRLGVLFSLFSKTPLFLMFAVVQLGETQAVFLDD